MCFMVQNVPHGLEKPLILGGYLTDLAASSYSNACQKCNIFCSTFYLKF